ncbi:MAG: glycosyltransferase family 2 protein [Aquamicrobium sp.]|uniref:glycosyltransferase n=1 Tax=Mesorhizobium sp. Pch-S TaxID=2082387 RepID=UPI001011F52D|nr:glycosyltransferase family 2 protein [Mesorhizobium sp. Pch-S]MBR2689777.1 glycosyltransferase family 2 protein [Aquamicrobium sp.]QAZ43725.1 glycosyl transferase family A [Mesorhizobium sp. Pch-S]
MTQPPSPRFQVDICVCTYRRPYLAETLGSLATLELPANVQARIIVADNDAAPSARDLATSIAPSLPFELIYIHCPASNISLARNACLDAAGGDYLAFVDDDSTVTAAWLATLIETAETSGADAVLGPVRSVYASTAPSWMRRGDFHSTNPVWVDGQIHTGYSGNVLLRRASPHVEGRRFNLSLGKTGGEDTEYFSQLHAAGGRIAYAERALVLEPVPADRARLQWLVKRRFRSGQTHGRLLASQKAGRKPVQIALAAAKAAYCFAGAAAVGIIPHKRNRQALRGIMHIGAISGLLGVREIRLYGEEPTGGRTHAA